MFTSNGVKRKAYRLLILDNVYILEPTAGVVPKTKIFPKANESEKFNIYIQSHALRRFKERMDIYEAPDRNFMFLSSLINSKCQKVVTDGKQKFLACAIDGCPVGYFTFFIIEDDLVINTFLPIVSDMVPEGKKLHELIPLGKEDMKYLNMDKASFLLDIDFDQIPVLKYAFTESGIWKAKKALETTVYKPVEKGIDMKKTMFVKSFFDKINEN